MLRYRSLALLVMVAAMTESVAETPAEKSLNRTDWFQKAGWGVFVHYLSDLYLPAEEVTPEKWNAVVESFDVEGLAQEIESTGAKYFFITLGQNSGYYCSPNATYDKLVGYSPSHCSKRDLIADLYEPLHKRGIRLMVYLPSGAPDRDTRAMKALEWTRGDFPNREFQIKWEAVIREWAERWGDKAGGWWFDGCYFSDAMYHNPEPPNFASFAAAARAGFKESIVGFNPGVLMPIITLTHEEDYTAGEINEPEKAECTGPRVGSAQLHMLTYLGETWAHGAPRFSDEQVIAITRKLLNCGGVVTWDAPVQKDGHIPGPFLAQLQALGKGLQTAPH